MKKLMAVSFFMITLMACQSNDQAIKSEATISFNFSHNWDGTIVTNTDFNNIQYTNANGDILSIERLRYLISKITFYKSNGEEIVLDGYNLVDVTNGTQLSFSSNALVPTGNYSNVSFLFGFDNEDNISGAYPDLNSASWNVPEMLGGGYHFMQLEGKFINDQSEEIGYAYHAIRAVDNSNPDNLIFQDTFIEVHLGSVMISNDTSFNVEMNVAEWFKNPNTWDLNVLYNSLMPNFNAQVMMYENGQNAFSLESVTP